MYTLSQELYDRTCAFVRTMAATCSQCLRSRTLCRECDISAAPTLLRALAEAKFPVEDRRVRTAPPSLKERCKVYLEFVSKENRWLLSREIDPANKLCGRGLKYWTLRYMAKNGMLKTYCAGKKIYFSTPNKELKK